MRTDPCECKTPLLHNVAVRGCSYMEHYDVMLGGGVVGDVGVAREGLYLRFSCKCKLPDSQIYRLTVRCDGKQTDLGICVPEGEWFALDRRVQSKHIGVGKLSFCVSPNKLCSDECFVHIDSSMPFPYLSRLQHAHFSRQGDCCGILLSE